MKILVPVEDPLFASALVEFISMHNWPVNTEFHVLHVVEPFLIDQVTQPAFAKLLSLSEAEIIHTGTRLVEDVSTELRKRLAGIQTSHELRVGRVVAEIMGTASRGSFDLIIAGSHGKGGFNRFLLGSVSLALASDAPCSVLLVKPQAEVLKKWDHISPNALSAMTLADFPLQAKDTKRLTKILVCVDNKDLSNKLIGFMSKHKWTHPARFRILSVVPPLKWLGFMPRPELESLHAELVESKRELVNVLAMKLKEHNHESEVDAGVLEAQPKQGIIEIAEKWNADLIVVGCHRKGNSERHTVGSVPLYLLSAANCSVLFLREEQKSVLSRDSSATAASLR